jgi:bifunctional non-homologous end joining protein LigD
MPTKKKTTSKKQLSPAEQVDEQLARYREMRHFDKTAEPVGQHPKSTTTPGNALPFVVQKHAATRLHYDFRLGWRGVLKSWAVTKGPSYVTADKRLAVQVEDHPMEYGGFEGVIPKGEYGGGTVMIWDQGTWEPLGNVDEDLARGNLKFILHGTKLKGKWVLVRMGGKAARESKPNWLLIKEHDDFERTPADPAITDQEPNSAVTGRDFDKIAGEKDHTWSSKSGLQEPTKDTKTAEPKKLNLPKLSTAQKESFPDFIPPALAYSVTDPPNGDNWIHELKLDGYRIQAQVHDGAKGKSGVRLLTRKGLDWTHRMPEIAEAVSQIPVKDAVFDGEVVVTDSSGLSSFASLQAAFQGKKTGDMTFFVFDILHLDGNNTRVLPLLERKEIVRTLVSQLPDDTPVRFSEHFQTNGSVMFDEACKLGAEGIVSKLASGKYISGRDRSWTKAKCVLEQEFVIGGYTLPNNGSHGVGALHIGYYKGKDLYYAGKTGTGFSQEVSGQLRDRLEKMKRKESPFVVTPADVKRKTIWVDPKLVAQIGFRTWTNDGLIRQSAFKGLREDKPASEVVKEQALQTKDLDAASDGPSSVVSTKKLAKTAVTQKTALDVKLTHADKVIDVESGLTKQALAEYYQEIAPHLLPHIAGRPVSIIRCPNGSGEKCFFQRHLSSSLPRGVEGIEITNKEGSETEMYITLSTREALVGLAQMNVFELHPWGSTNDDIEHPDRLIFDLDPDAAIPWPILAEAALEVRARLKKLGLQSFVKVTGGKGIHVISPLERILDWPALKSFAHSFVLNMENENPTMYLTKMTKVARKDKIYLDYLRNERGATAVAPYSPRARSGMPVSMPLAWSELSEKSAPRFRVVDFAEWKSRLKRDPWKGLLSLKQRLKTQIP